MEIFMLVIKEIKKDSFILIVNEEFPKCLEESIIKDDLPSNFKYLWYTMAKVFEVKDMRKIVYNAI